MTFVGPMSLEDFLQWEARQTEKWEFVDGVPLRRRDRMMVGGTAVHALICSRIIAALTPRLRGGPCVPMTSDLKTVSARGAVRYPDVTIDCGTPRPGQQQSSDPKVVFEVTSPSNTFRQQIKLLEDYQGVATLQHIVFVSQSEAAVLCWTRTPAGWTRDETEGLEGSVSLSLLDLALPLAEIYEGVVFDPAPTDEA
jgi:Uma2 family endonuclease